MFPFMVITKNKDKNKHGTQIREKKRQLHTYLYTFGRVFVHFMETTVDSLPSFFFGIVLMCGLVRMYIFCSRFGQNCENEYELTDAKKIFNDHFFVRCVRVCRPSFSR